MSSPFKPRLSLITLGVADVARAKAFYDALGLKAAKASQGDVVFYQLSGVVLALYPRELLAEDALVAHDGAGFDGVTIAQNLESEAEVDAAMDHALTCGAILKKKPQKVFWGGYSGYFADPDGHLWELAYNPFFPFDERGILSLD
ncbi:VOC family protein [Oryzibacter oryziterrae]|uniref:VOC family protein n=1 Tax=Oryzibacter oryziterrae TaxID=2766474 RepID=UPI001F223C12|nr:VOC family protein [Oryzibacter oryziterrae]